MTKEEMAKAYAEGFSEEYREIAHDAFLCGYGAKCTTEIPNDLEEAADIYASDSTGFIDMTAYRAFIAGAKWDREQMMKGAVEGEVRKNGTVGYFEFSNEQQFHSLLEQFQDCDKVHIIVVKED